MNRRTGEPMIHDDSRLGIDPYVVAFDILMRNFDGIRVVVANISWERTYASPSFDKFWLSEVRMLPASWLYFTIVIAKLEYGICIMWGRRTI
jgi:hypothetical protein